jgi:hypothetical protein
VKEHPTDFAGRPCEQFSLFAVISERWDPRFKERYDADAARRATRQDGYLAKPSSSTQFTDPEPLPARERPNEVHVRIVLPEDAFVGKDLNEIVIKTLRARDVLSCRVGGAIFYRMMFAPLKDNKAEPGRRSCLCGFSRAVYFRYDNDDSESIYDNPEMLHDALFLAIPLNKGNQMVTSRVFTSNTVSGIGWLPYQGDPMMVARWLAQRIHSSVTVSTLREVKLVPAPPIDDPPNSYFAQLKNAYEKALRSEKVMVLPPEAYTGKNINEIIIPTSEFQAGGVVFYMAYLWRFGWAVQAKYTRVPASTEDEVPVCRLSTWFAFPVTDKHQLLTGELFASTLGSTFGRWLEDRLPIVRWFAEHIHPSVTVTEFALQPLPMPWPSPSDKNDAYAVVLRKRVQAARAARQVTVLNPKFYKGKELSAIPMQVQEGKGLQVGGCSFWALFDKGTKHQIGVYTRLEAEQDCEAGEIAITRTLGDWYAFQTDASGFMYTDPIFLSSLPFNWREYAGDRQQILVRMAAAIDPSVTVTKVRKWDVKLPPRLPEDPNSYATQLRERARQLQSHALIVLQPAKYEGKRLREIRLEMVKGTVFFGCKVGKLVFYPVSQGKYAAVRGNDLFPPFYDMWFAFKLKRSVPDCASVYYPSDEGWQVYAPGNQQFLDNIIALVMHAIAPSNPIPELCDYAEDRDASGTVWIAMLNAYQEKSAARNFFAQATPLPLVFGDRGALAHGVEWQFEHLLKSKMPEPAKLRKLESFLAGGLYPVSWERLEKLLSSPALGSQGQKWGSRAKKETYLSALRFGDEQYAAQMLTDPLIKAIEYSAEAEAARRQPEFPDSETDA